VSTLEVRQRLGDLLNRVALRHDQFVIARKGRPLAALVPVEKLARMERLVRGRLLELMERQRGASLTEAEADRLADQAKHRSRQARDAKRGRSRRAARRT
jgi:prevent-host-death family protein